MIDKQGGYRELPRSRIRYATYVMRSSGEQTHSPCSSKIGRLYTENVSEIAAGRPPRGHSWFKLERVAESQTTGPGIEVEVVLAGKAVRFQCQLIGIARGRAHLQSPRWLESGTELTAHLKLISIPAGVLYCHQKSPGYRICLSIGAESQRSEPRFPVDFPAWGTVFIGSNEPRTFDAVVTDISPSGIGLRMPIACPEDAMICVETDVYVVAGEIKHCVKEPGRETFHAGVRVFDVFEGTPRLQQAEARSAARRKILGVIKRTARLQA
ncbi:MAG TPA: hypothetical protein VG297_06630 [Bryobacteraceae bacterium]|nr:hypothetical protein [Bryobacteraceae bacterium]